MLQYSYSESIRYIREAEVNIMAEKIIVEKIKFDSQGLVPVIVQDADSKEVLMLAYANQTALEKSIETGEAHYYSRSRKELWHKGATSGHIQYIKNISYDCDGDTVLYQVDQKGVACHTGSYSCFYRSLLDSENSGNQKFDTKISALENSAKNSTKNSTENSTENSVIGSTLAQLSQVISNRKLEPKEGSYTNYLFEKGIDKILKKVGEETAEVIIAAKNSDKKETLYESADLLYHLTVLLTAMDLNWPDVMTELEKRVK